MRADARWPALAAGVALTLLGLAVALANGAALVQNDTVSYVRNIQFLSEHLGNLVQPPAASIFGENTRWLPAPERSLYYGLLAWLGYGAGGFWLTMAVQSALLAFLAHRLLVVVLGLSLSAYAAAVALTYATSALGFYVASIMPDVFGGFALLAAILLVLFPQRLTRADRVGIGLIALASILAHTANLLLFVGLGLALALLRLVAPGPEGMPGRPARGGGAMAALLVLGLGLVGVVGDRLAQGAVARVSGVTPVRAPFLTARLIGDGPGLAYLRAVCDRDADTYLLCRFRDRLPLGDDEFLWNTDPARGVYMTVDHATQGALAAEQTRFALGTLLFAPLPEAAAALRNAGTLFSRFGLGAFDIGRTRDSVEAFFREGLPAFDTAHISGPVVTNSAALRILGFAFLSAYWLALLVLAAVALVPALRRRLVGTVPERLAAARALATAVVLGLVLNALVCGALSGPYSRYQGRVSWVPVLVVLGLAAGRALPRRTSRTRRHGEDA